MDILSAAKYLYDLGFNTVPVYSDKRPLVSWSARERRSFSELEKYFAKAEGVAVTGLRLWSSSDYGIVIIDVDDVEAGEKVLRQVFGDWRMRLCGQGWSFCGLSGPRPKNYWQCSEDGTCRGSSGEVKNIGEIQRGFYIVIRTPISCTPQNSIRGNVGNARAIELLIDNYQVVYGKHPSGALYQPARWDGEKWVPVPITEVGEGETVTCSELSRLITLISSLNGDEGRSPEEISELGEYATNLPEPSRHLEDEEREVVAQFLKSIWGVVDNDGKKYHDFAIFGVASLARRAGVSKDDILGILDEICTYAIANGLDNESTCRQHRYVVEWVYADRPGRRIWGRRSFENAVKPAVARVAPDVDVALSSLYEALGYQADAPLCIPITRQRERGEGLDGRYRDVEWICNDPKFGIIRKVLTRKRRKAENGGESIEVIVENSKTLLPAYFTKVEIYSDILFNLAYYSISAVNIENKSIVNLSMVSKDEVVNAFKSDVTVWTPNWAVILSKWKPIVEDVIVSGFVCAPHLGIECRVRDYFNVGIGIEPDPAKARGVVESLIDIVNQLHPEPEVWLTALAYSLFTAFTLTRKLHGVKSMIVALVGVRDSGKTTVANDVAARMLNPNVNLLMPAAATLTPARIGRLTGMVKVVTTGPIVLDEGGKASAGGYIEISGDVEQVLKSYVSPGQLYSWQTATGLKFPAASGIVITANELRIVNPAMEEKVARVEFTRPISKANMEEFSKWLIANRDDLKHFGAYYLKYAEKNWRSGASEIVLNPDWQRAAVEYFNTVLSSLGLKPLELIITRPTSSYRERLRVILDEYVMKYSSSQCRDKAYTDCIQVLARDFYIPWLRFVEDSDGRYFVILPSFKEYSGIPPKAICNEIAGAKLDKSSRNVRYYNRCIIPEASFYTYLSLTQPNIEGKAKEE